MKLGKFVIPRGFSTEGRLLALLQKRDDEIRKAINLGQETNANAAASWMGVGKCSKPGTSLVETEGATIKTIVEAPPAGTRRVIRHVTWWNGDSVPKTLSVSLHDGAEYWGIVGLGADTLHDVAFPTYNGVLVLEPGMSLRTAILTGQVLAPGYVTAHWEDERVDGDSQPLAGSNLVKTDDSLLVWATAVPSPPAGTMRVVRLVTFSNSDNKVSAPIFRINDGTTEAVISYDTVGHAQWASSEFPQSNGVYVIAPGSELQVRLFGNKQTNNCPVTAHWLDHREEGEGEN